MVGMDIDVFDVAHAEVIVAEALKCYKALDPHMRIKEVELDIQTDWVFLTFKDGSRFRLTPEPLSM